LPDYRLTCIFVDRNYRRKGVARVALDGAFDLIARAGGGVVEAYPHDTTGKKMSSSFLCDGTRSMYEKAGFDYERPKGQEQLRDAQGRPCPVAAGRLVSRGAIRGTPDPSPAWSAGAAAPAEQGFDEPLQVGRTWNYGSEDRACEPSAFCFNH
jgi:hypothetical protein